MKYNVQTASHYPEQTGDIGRHIKVIWADGSPINSETVIIKVLFYMGVIKNTH